MNVPIGEFYPAVAAVVQNVESAPAAGAAIDQVLIGGIVTTAWMFAIMVLGLRHRAGKTDKLDRLGAFASAKSGLPGWTIVPYLVSMLALAVAGVGFVWDVSLHLDRGRDPGPFANPSHYMLIVGTVLFVTAGWLAVVMPKGESAGASAVRVGRNWLAPAAGIAMLACGLMSVSGFALDDVWHRLFGQDVTLWGPTHLMMITGGLLVLFSSMVLIREGIRTIKQPRTAKEREAGSNKSLTSWISTALFAGGALTGLTIAYQQEFSYGFPQFRLLFHPVLIAMSAGIVLTAARTLYGRGGAMIAMAGALAINVLLMIIVGPVFGQITLHFPLYVVEALLVEGAALVFLSRGRYTFAIAAGMLIGTVGVLAEFGWSHIWMPIEWPAHILPKAMAFSVVPGIGGAVIGTFFGTTLTAATDSARLGRRAAWPPLAAMAAIALVVLMLLPTTAPESVTGTVALTNVTTGPKRLVNATIKYSDPKFEENADWIVGFAWQGDGKATVAPLARVSPGVWRTTEPLPVYGTWKAALRVQKGSAMASIPLYMPADAALKLPVTRAPANFTRAVVGDRTMMQRERRTDVPGWLFAFGSSVVALLTVSLMILLGWALLRVARGGPLEPEPRGVAEDARGLEAHPA
jgi:hypothetical protein